jgi:hypothetical protein
MRQLVIRYRVKPDQGERNAELIRAVFDELRASAPEGFHYATFQVDDGRTFVHFVTETDPEHSPLPELPAFQRFSAGVRERCEEPPVTTELRQIDSYRLFAEAPAPSAAR